jgi:transposase
MQEVTCPNCERLWRRVEELEHQNAELKTENAQLKSRLAAYENAHTAPSQRKFPIRRYHNYGGPRYPGRPKGILGRTRQTPKPNLTLKAEMDRCPHCGSPLDMPTSVKRTVVEEIPEPPPKRVIEFLEANYDCPRCGAHVAARNPDLPPEGRFGKNVYVQTTLLRYEERLPLRKVQTALERQNLTVTPSTVLEVLRRASTWLRPEYERILQRIRAADVVYTDETGIKVDGRQYWIWAFTTITETLVAVRKSRGKKTLKEILGDDFKGIIVCDGWKSYPNFTSRIQRCWAHLLREARYLADRIDEAKPLSETLHQLYSRLTTKLGDRPPPEEMTRTVEDAKKIMTSWARRPYKTGEVKKFAAKIRNGIDHWFTFLNTPGVEPTNNRAERALREHVVQRKIIGTLRNQKGTFIHETITTLLATWKQQEQDPSTKLATTLSLNWQSS